MRRLHNPDTRFSPSPGLRRLAPSPLRFDDSYDGAWSPPTRSRPIERPPSRSQRAEDSPSREEVIDSIPVTFGESEIRLVEKEAGVSFVEANSALQIAGGDIVRAIVHALITDCNPTSW